MQTLIPMGGTVHSLGTDMASKITLRRDNLAKFRRIAGLESDRAFAKRIGVNHSQVSRVLSGNSRIGTRFIAGCLETFGVECFADLFAIEPDDDNGAAA